MFLLLPTLSTLFIVISAILVAVGWRLILKNKRKQHERVMIAAAIFAIAFFIIYVSRTVFLGNVAFGGPDSLKPFYTVFLIFHIVLATVGAIFGLITLTHAFKKNFLKHKKIAPWTAVIWFISASTGFLVYLSLYILYPNSETTSLIKAILGS